MVVNRFVDTLLHSHRIYVTDASGVVETDMSSYEERIGRLGDSLSETGGCAVCFSGGLDSTVLMDIAHRVLGDGAVAVIADVPMMSDRQRDAAEKVLGHIGCRYVRVGVPAEDLKCILGNGHDRCYICKTAMYSAIRSVAEGIGIRTIVNGEIVDDLSEDRPGMVAGKENGILTPMIDAGITRSDVVRYIDGMDLPLGLVKDTCMLMRFQEGTEVSWDDLREVESLEDAVRSLTGLKQLRIRRVGDGYSVQTSSLEYNVLERCFPEVEELFGSRGLRAEINRVGYDK